MVLDVGVDEGAAALGWGHRHLFEGPGQCRILFGARLARRD